MVVPAALLLLISLPAQHPCLPDLDGNLRRHRPGSVVVALDVKAAEPLVLLDHRALELDEALRLPGGPSGGRVMDRCPALGMVRVEIPEGEEVGSACRRLSALPGVRYAEPDWMGEGGVTVNDTYFASQWHLRLIEAPAAWEMSRGSTEVIVAVLDTGIVLDHPEFVSRVIPGHDFVNGDEDPTADHPHGVSATGVLAANADNLFGLAGVDHRSRILPIKVLDEENLGTDWDLIQGIRYAVDRGARVINMSLINYPRSQGLEEALAYARDRGAVLVACAGNLGPGDADISWPGASPLCISVGATTDEDSRASFSGTGQALDVVAPGKDLLTVSMGLSDGFTQFSGCSAAAPVASGIAALLLAVDPYLTPDEVRALIEGGAEDQVGGLDDVPGWDSGYGWGRVNARRSLELLSRGNRFRRGDSNNDQAIDISDALFTLQRLFHEARPFPCHDAADATDDGRIDLADPIRLLTHLFIGGDLPPPTAVCSVDRSLDDLECVSECVP